MAEQLHEGENESDQACWLHLVCDECGALVTARDGHRPTCSSFVATVKPNAASSAQH